MKKYYKLVIDQDSVPFDYVEIDPITKQPIDDFHKMYEDMFTLSTSFMDISHLNYDPVLGSIWDGENFKSDKGVQEILYDKDKFTRIAFINKDKYLGRIMYNGTDKAKMRVAALLSNPKIVLDRIED